MTVAKYFSHALPRTYAIGAGATLLLLATVVTGVYLGQQTQQRFRNVAGSWSTFSQQADQKGLWLSEIRGHIGYGGIIHDFKNYVLRQDEQYSSAVRQRLPSFYRSIDAYLGSTTTEGERVALRTIRTTIEAYEARLPVAEQAAREGRPVIEIDRLVRVDDRDAVQAHRQIEEIWQASRNVATADIRNAVEQGEALINLGFQFLFGLAIVAVILFVLFYLIVRELQDTVQKLSGELADRLRAEQSEKKLLRAVEQSPATIVITDTAGRIEYVNRRFEELTGYARAEVMGSTPRFLQSGDTAADLYAAIRAKLAHGQEYRGVFRNKKKSGASYWAETTILPLTDDDRVVRNFIGIGEDITEKREAREQVIKAQKMEAVGLLAGGVAHDFNNVLTTILGAAHLASLDADPDSEIGREIAQIEIAARRARALVNQLLTFARRQPGEPRHLNLQNEIAEVVRLIQASIPRTIRIEANLGDRPSWVRVDPTQLHQVLMNLCRNAAEAVPTEGGIIRLELDVTPNLARRVASGDAEQTWLKLVVSDNGSGVAPDVARRMFDAFFTTKPLGKGTGLGLTIVASLVEEMGGSISLTTTAPMGANFEILLPGVEPGAAPAEKAEDVPRGTESILLVDDESDVVAVQRRLLMRLGYRVAAYSDPAVALSEFSREPGRFDLVMTDLVMPGMNGEALASEVDKLNPGIPIIISTAYRPSDLSHRVAPSYIVLAKPSDPGDLARTIRRLLDQRRRGNEGATQA